MFNRFSENAKKAIVFAKNEARRLNHDYIGTEHFLSGLIKGDAVAANVLLSLGLDLDTIRTELEKSWKSLPSTLAPGDIPFTPQAKKVLELSADEARGLGHNYIGTEHFLLGLIQVRCKASEILNTLGIDIENLRAKIKEMFGYIKEEMSRESTPDSIMRSEVLFLKRHIESLEARIKKLEEKLS